MRRCIIHVGMPKAGSTTLQHFLRRHRKSLLRKGVFTPLVGKRLLYRELFESLAHDRAPFESTLLPELDRGCEEAGCETLLLSYEGLQRLAPDRQGPARLAASFGQRGFRVTFVAVVRPQAQFMNSFYSHAVLYFRTGKRFRLYVEAALQEQRYDYDQRLAQWIDCPGAEFRALPLAAARGNLAKRFLEVCELPRISAAREEPPVKNERPGVITMELLLRLRRQGAHYRFGDNENKARRWLRQEVLTRGWKEPRFMGLDDELAARIRARYAIVNQNFARRHFGEDWDSLFAVENGQSFRCNECDPAVADPRLISEIEALAAEALARYSAPSSANLLPGLASQWREIRQRLKRRDWTPGASD
ncbi:hypothetical protein [Aquibaculum sediminis]|uniref:hypothetical protein n=1 Tax=Aquibaculum sediminis TaxID=3231907 RepID=UPI00345711D9